MIFLDIAIKSTLIAAVGLFGLLLLRRSSASARHFALGVTLVGLCGIPAISLLLPHWELPFLVIQQAAAPIADAGPATFTSLPQSVESVPAAIDPSTVVLLAWASVAALLLLRVAFRLVRLARLERTLPMESDPALQALVTSQCRRSGRHVLLLQGASTEPPMVWGHVRPVLLLPSHAATWPPERLQSVVLHELAHIERRDWIAGVLAQAACALNWFNPFAWMIVRRMEIESETAADDHVLGMGVSPIKYASHLLDVTRDLRRGRASTNVALAMARPGKLDRRLTAILEQKRCRRTTKGVMALGLAAGVTGLVVVVGVAAPTVVRQVANPTTVSAARGDAFPVTTPPVNVPHVEVKVAEVRPSTKSHPSSPHIEAPRTYHPSAHHPRPRLASQSARPAPTRVTLAHMSGEPAVHIDNHLTAPSPMVVANADASLSPKDLKDMETQVNRAGIEAKQEVEKALKEANLPAEGRDALSEATRQIVASSAGVALNMIRTSTKSALASIKNVDFSRAFSQHWVGPKHMDLASKRNPRLQHMTGRKDLKIRIDLPSPPAPPHKPIPDDPDDSNNSDD